MTPTDIARQFIGEKEKPNNGGFYNPELQAMMTAAGHKKGESWCCYFAEAVFVKAYPDKEKELRRFFSGSCVQTFRNFRDGVKVKDGKGGIKLITWPHGISEKPLVNSLVLWQRYKDGNPTGLGHAGIVTEKVTETIFKDVEGNTNRDGSREGEVVFPKTRSTAWNENGLNVMGFVPIEI